MDAGWLSSQLVVGGFVVVLIVGGLAFFALAEPGRGAPAAGGGAADGTRVGTDGGTDDVSPAGGPQTASHEAGEPATGGQPDDGRPATGRPAADPAPGDPAAASIFETEPCWLSLLRGGRASADEGVAPVAFLGGTDGVDHPG